ncbi:MAG: response regulator [Polyangiaceae bacterium]|nr:response regulator [Polyangiaceae bacterium]
MSKGRVLVIDDDEWVCRLLAVAMKEAGFEITISENAADGFYRAVQEQPDCIVCDVDLPDHNGYWVAKKIRSHPSRISMAPFVFLSGLDDREHRLEGFQVGGDAYLTKPFRIDEVVAQVDALIQMAARLRKARQTLTSMPPTSAAMLGDLAQMSVGTLLTLLDLERRSGVLELKCGDEKALIRIASGSVVSTTLSGVDVPALDALRRAMSWTSGKFSFSPSEQAAPGGDGGSPINALLMEAARLEDEERAGEGRPSSARVWQEVSRASSSRPQEGSTPAPPDLPRTPHPAAAAAKTPEPQRVEAPKPAPPKLELPALDGPKPEPQKIELPKALRPETPKPGLPSPRPGPAAPALGAGAAPKPTLPAPTSKSVAGMAAVRPAAKPPLPGRTGFTPAMSSGPKSVRPATVITSASSTPPGPTAPAAAPTDAVDEGWSAPPSSAAAADEGLELEDLPVSSKDAK